MYAVQFGGATTTLQCNDGFTASTYGRITCVNNFWSQVGVCLQATTPPPPPGFCTQQNVPLVQGGTYTVQYGGTTATLQCMQGYTASSYGRSIQCANGVNGPMAIWRQLHARTSTAAADRF